MICISEKSSPSQPEQSCRGGHGSTFKIISSGITRFVCIQVQVRVMYSVFFKQTHIVLIFADFEYCL